MKKTICLSVIIMMLVSAISGCGSVFYGVNTQETNSDVSDVEVSETAAVSEDAEPAGDTDDGKLDDGDVSAVPAASPDASDEPADDEIPAADYSAVTVEADTFEYSSEYIEVSIVTPRVAGLPDGAVQERINAVFSEYSQLAQAGVAPFEEESKSIFDEGYSMGPYVIEIGYDVMYLQNGLLSLTVTDYIYLGGAHGSAALLAYTFDLETGEQLQLNDLMSGDSYLGYINGFIREEIDRRVAEEELYELASFEDFGDSPQWYLTDNEFVFYFQQYEYFPYAAGIQRFNITYTELQDFINDDYISRFSIFNSRYACLLP